MPFSGGLGVKKIVGLREDMTNIISRRIFLTRRYGQTAVWRYVKFSLSRYSSTKFSRIEIKCSFVLCLNIYGFLGELDYFELIILCLFLHVGKV